MSSFKIDAPFWAPVLFCQKKSAGTGTKQSAEKSESAERKRKKQEFAFFWSLPSTALEVQFQGPDSPVRQSYACISVLAVLS